MRKSHLSFRSNLPKGTGATAKRFVAVTIYAIAMGYLESAVVIYLRQSAFGNSTQLFPFKFLEPQLGGVELIRESATIIMLLSVGYLAGKNRFQQWMFFVFTFAVWDIFYYVFLRLFTGWPATLGDFDVLFLFPVIWVSPVICPILISLLLSSASALLIFLSGKTDKLSISRLNLTILLLGGATIFYSFTEQVLHILFQRGPRGIENYSPLPFDWRLFSAGFLALCLAATFTIKDCLRKIKTGQSTTQDKNIVE